MPEKSWTIGSDPSCDLVVQSNTVSARHCRLTVDGREWKLTDLGSTNGTYVNGERLFGDRAVELTDSITLGHSQPMPWPDRPKSLDQADTDTAPSAAKSTKSQRKTVSIGRGPNNDVVLRDSNVSTNHARLIVAGTEIHLEDLGSTNGTSIGKVENKISRGTVQLNDTVFFGSTSYRVSDLLGQRQPVLVEPEIRPKRDVISPSIQSRRRVTWAVSSLGVLLLLVGFGWWLRSGPNEAETERAETKTPLSNLPETAVATDSLKSTSEEEKRVPAVMEPVEDDVSPEEQLARSVFLVVCSDSERETPYRVGTGFSIDSKTVVTSASVIQAMRSLQRNGYPEAFLFSPANQSELQILSTVLHPNYEAAERAARQAEQRYDAVYDELGSERPKPEAVEAVEKKLIDASMEVFASLDHKSTYDVAVINTSVSLKHWLPEVSVDAKLRPKQKINVTGYAIDVEDRFFDRTVPFELSTMSSRISQLVSGFNSSDRRLVANCNPDQQEYAYLGSPVLNDQGQIVGVYTRRSPPTPGSEDQSLHSFDAALIKRVHECRPSTPAL